MRLQTAACALICALTSGVASAQEASSFDSAGVRIRYLQQGHGEPVVLVHGFMNEAADWIRIGVFPELAKQYRVIALDARGHGGSDKPHDPKSYGRQMALDIVRLLDHLNIQRAHIVGYSMGGGIVAHLVTRHPERFLSVTFGGNAGRRSWTAAEEEAARLESEELSTGILRRMLTRLAPTNGPPPTEDEIRAGSERRLQGKDRLALAAVSHPVSRGDFFAPTQDLAAVTVPALGIVGSLDPVLPLFRELKTAMPQLELLVIDGASHGLAPSRPEFLDALKALFSRASQRPTK